jgi:methylenetetrahydrofolate--tRNA-(uracil-5-)-methyltransferase
MNANFGILPELERNIKDKKERNQAFADRSIEIIKNSTN